MSIKRVRTKNTLKMNGGIHPTKRKNAARGIMLNKFYNKHAFFTFPTEIEKRKLSEIANITVKQVPTWFSNTRSRRRNTNPRKKKERRADILSDTDSDVDVVSFTEAIKEKVIQLVMTVILTVTVVP